MVAKEFESVILPPEVTILQYTDDTLIEEHDEEMVHQSMNAIVQHLEELNISVPDLKQQGPSQEATFSGIYWRTENCYRICINRDTKHSRTFW